MTRACDIGAWLATRQRQWGVIMIGLVMAGAILLVPAPAAAADLPPESIPPGHMLLDDIVVPVDFLDERTVYNTNLWIRHIVPYAFSDDVTPTNQQRALNAMAELESHTNIKFVPRTTEGSYVYIFSGTANWSQVGQVGGAQTLSLVSWNWHYIIVHELMHALGMWHEQSRVDRDQYVQIEVDNILEDQRHNFYIHNGIINGPYDFDSVMHYDQCAWTNCACPSTCVAITVLPPNEGWQNLIGQLNHLSTGDIAGLQQMYGLPDCNTNGVHDYFDVDAGTSLDCNRNGVPDECDLTDGTSADCDENNVPDECEADCNHNHVLDACDIDSGTSNDDNSNGIPDECEEDCNHNGVLDYEDITAGTSEDCNTNSVPDECDIASGPSHDVDGNGTPDECDPDCNENLVPDGFDIQLGTSTDYNDDGVPDDCQDTDCNENLLPDILEIHVGLAPDVNGNWIPDACEPDCNENDTPDDHDITQGTSFDCNENTIPDECDIAGGAALDCNADGVPDACEAERVCPSDVNRDCTVNTDDFLITLVAWGTCAAPCPPTCIGDVDGDCIVNTDDFLAVLVGWGNCD